MSDDLAAPNDSRRGSLLFWMILAVVFAAGLYLGLTRSQQPTISLWIERLLAAALVGAGIFNLIAARDIPARATRTRLGAVGTIIFGVTIVVPSGAVKMTLSGVAMVFFLAAILDIPKRLFPQRPS